MWFCIRFEVTSRVHLQFMLGSHVHVQEFLGWLSKNCDENPCMRNIFNSKSPPKGRACADSRRNFWTTNLKAPVSTDKDQECYYSGSLVIPT